MADESAELRHARPRGPRSNWVPLGVSVVVVAVLTGGWAAVNAALPATESMTSGHSMTLGSGEGYEASVTFDEGWELDKGASSQGQRYLFTKGPVNLHLAVVHPPQRATATDLWDGMRDTVRVDDTGARLNDPEPITSDRGAEGLTGDLHIHRHTGTATIFPAPSGDFAVEAQAVGADASPAELADAENLVESITFDRARGGNT